MGGSSLARWLTVVVAATVLLAGCTNKVGGAGVKAKESEPANVSLMDTGSYPTRLGHIFGTAGDDKFAQSLLEAHRLADFVVGPWQVDETISQFPFLELLIQIGGIPTTDQLEKVFGREFSSVAAKHGYITGFSTKRVSPGNPPTRGLTNTVLRFSDPAAAAAAAAELARRIAPFPEIHRTNQRSSISTPRPWRSGTCRSMVTGRPTVSHRTDPLSSTKPPSTTPVTAES